MNSESSSKVEVGPTTVLRHICEVCGKTEEISTQEAYQTGWDYPPGIGAFGVVSPRTCGDCGINQTLWWRIVVEKLAHEDFTDADLILIKRILDEPASVLVKDSG